MPPPTKQILFSTFNVTSQVFHTTPLSFCIVNLRPLLPGHVLVCPSRPTARFRALSAAEVADLFTTAQRVGRMLERVFRADALNVAVQDGREAGQSVPHVHVHVIPRRKDDLGSKEGDGDRLYEMLEGEQGDVGRALTERERAKDVEDWPVSGEARPREGVGGGFPKVEEISRRDRTEEEMTREAEWLRAEMDKEERD